MHRLIVANMTSSLNLLLLQSLVAMTDYLSDNCICTILDTGLLAQTWEYDVQRNINIVERLVELLQDKASGTCQENKMTIEVT